MIINIKDTLTLDDYNEYVVVSKTNYEGVNYYYLVDKNNNENVLFCFEEKDELVELIDKELTTKLLPIFYKEAENEIKDIMDSIKKNDD